MDSVLVLFYTEAVFLLCCIPRVRLSWMRTSLRTLRSRTVRRWSSLDRELERVRRFNQVPAED